MRFAITICATKKYAYAMRDQAATVQSSLRYANINDPIIILVTDNSGVMNEIAAIYQDLLPEATVVIKEIPDLTEAKNYEAEAQLVISKMRSVAFNEARKQNVDFCLSLDSDVLPAVNGIQTCLDMLNFDKGYYNVACMLYTSQGGGPWLCGRGTTTHQILPDFYPDERIIPQRYLDFQAKYEEKLKSVDNAEDARKVHSKLGWVRKRFDKYPPIGNVFSCNSKKWKKRGWFDNAYPALGKGACVPTDWCGFGATMMSKKALSYALFDGYQGGGTEDLFICYHKWRPNNIRLVAIPHSPCDHIVRNRAEPGKYTHVHGLHQEAGEYEGHLTQVWSPYVPQY